MLDPTSNYILGRSAYHVSLMDETMGGRIRGLRESRKMSQDDLGRVLGITGAAVSQWESDATKNIKPDNLLMFCSLFSADPYWLVFGADGPPKLDQAGTSPPRRTSSKPGTGKQ